MQVKLHVSELMEVVTLDVTYDYYQEDLQIDTVKLNSICFRDELTDVEFSELQSLVEKEHLK